jgi:predicted metal-dependent enzyme (double-stranded beta helix superfamily)
MQQLWARELPEGERWDEVAKLLPMLLEDAELRALAQQWELTQALDGKHTNLLFYEDPRHGFVINALVKAPGAATPVHDHAHTWTAYSVIYGSERVVRYRLEQDVAPGDVARLTEVASYVVQPGFVDVVPPRLPHAEYVGDSRTAAIIVRSARIGGFDQRMWKHKTHVHFLAPGPRQIPYTPR